MKQEIVSKNRVSEVIINRARAMLESGERPYTLNRGDIYKYNLGREYRLVSKDRKKWLLMTHQQYNKYITR